MTREDPRSCPAGTAVKARPFLTQDPKPPFVGKPWEDFTLAPFMAALDRIEHARRPPEQVIAELHSTQGTFERRSRPAHPGLLAWTEAAVLRYLTAREAEEAEREASGAPRTYPVAEEWVARTELRAPDARGATLYERTAWGRRYVSLCGTVRELRLFSFGSATQERPSAEVAAAAYTAMFGEPCRPAAYGKPYVPVPTEELPAARTVRPQRVRVVAVGSGDGSSVVLADWDEEQVKQRFAEASVPALRRAVDAVDRRPASDCSGCPAIAGCDALPRTTELLGVPALPRRRKRRTVSVSDLRAHSSCPARYHLTRELNLRSPRPESEAVRRGRAVDDWLNEQHARRPHRPCAPEPGPDTPEAWAARGFELGPEAARVASLMIAQHAWSCPLDGLAENEDVFVQRQVVAYDDPLDVIAIATPDLVHTLDSGVVWRETKTATKPPGRGRSLLRRWPQIALAVLLFDSGALGGDPARSRVELEFLYEHDTEVRGVDPGLKDVVDEARQVIRELADPWSRDTSYTPRAGSECAACEALDWCGPGLAHLAANPRHSS
ncbi:PD-(D/E)XK nuclease family protein [Streptomyces sp. NBC_00444]|uniref:PD-(D/E)XK nuclease family protein n=1 Tax=Streptomyces sp. NBC_00444 TaxID=2975744 RepID=UPI002E23D494